MKNSAKRTATKGVVRAQARATESLTHAVAGGWQRGRLVRQWHGGGRGRAPCTVDAPHVLGKLCWRLWTPGHTSRTPCDQMCGPDADATTCIRQRLLSRTWRK